MSQLSKNELKAENQSQFPNNNIGAITPSHLRAFNVDFIDSTVNQTTFNEYSASVEAQIAALDPSGSAESILALNQFTQSADGRLDALEAATSSYATSAITASSLITASFNNGTRNLTFTKGDSSTFNVNIPDVSGSSGNFVTTSSFNAFTQSIDGRVDSLEAATSSYAISSSVAAVDAAQQAQINSIIAATGSYVTESETGSFATTGSNTFYGTQNISGSMLPVVDGQGDLGNDSLKWNQIVVNGQIKGSSLNTTGRASVGTIRVTDETFPLSFLNDREIVADGTGANTHIYYGTSSVNLNGLREFVYTQSGSNADFAAVSASFDTRINNITGSGGTINTGSFATTGSNTFVGIQNFTNEITASNTLINGDLVVNPATSTKLNGNTDVGSFLYVGGGLTLNTPANITWLGSGTIGAGFSASVASQFASITPAATGSLLVTASAAGADITFTKGDGSTFSVTVATGSVASASFAETASIATNALDIVVNVKNTTGAQINKGTVVRIIGATGDNPLIGTASWTDDTTSANTLGFVVADIPNDAFGRVMTQGTLLSINTDPTLGYAAGQLVYLSSSGQFTNVQPPAPYHEVRLGQVLRAQQNNDAIS